MFRAGVPIMAGTDAINPFCFPGFSLHDELAMMVDSGLTPLAALQSATINPAKFPAGGESKLNAKDFSLIEPGKIANLVLLRADPLADIHNTTRIQAFWLRGKYFDQAALAQLLETASKPPNFSYFLPTAAPLVRTNPSLARVRSHFRPIVDRILRPFHRRHRMFL
jgi:adenine deaminase